MSEFLLLKILCHHIRTSRITYQDHCVSEFLGTKVKMKHRTVAIDYKF
jgi:hypothetical protein